MDRCPDGGKPWRTWITPLLKEMGVIVFDPTNKPIKTGTESVEGRFYRECLKQESKYDQLSAEYRQISNVDLRMVDVVDFLIVHLDLDIYPAGTIYEMVVANMQKKPILLHMEQGKNKVPDWWFGRLPHKEFFSDWNDMVHYLRYINLGNNPHSNRWLFFDKEVLIA
jgi:hypothetical protein